MKTGRWAPPVTVGPIAVQGRATGCRWVFRGTQAPWFADGSPAARTDPATATPFAEVASGSRDIAEGIGVVSDAVDGTRVSVTASHRAADELNATACRLTVLVDRFRV
ncbi:hypothetical protein [Actinoplanes sp. NPDC026619]|uniref:hypothetical protein n=1 Tax=Actinoplanes sp. NPDC026619 TaxID=3155798 RepID=UPI0033E791EA